jgi:hypothetical protein
VDHDPNAPWNTARARHVKVVSGSIDAAGVWVTFDPLPTPPTGPES